MSVVLVVWTGTQQEFYDWAFENLFGAAGDKALDDEGRIAYNITSSSGSMWARLRRLSWDPVTPVELRCFGTFDQAPDASATWSALAAMGIARRGNPSLGELHRAGTELVYMAHALAEASRVAPNES